MNEAKQKDNESAFLRSEGDVFILCAQDRHHDTCPQSFQLQNDANGIFQGSTKVFNSQEVIWILFSNPKCGQLTRIKNEHLFEHEIHPTSTPIEPITRTQFPIQLVVARTIH
jgi:hypothetical protein